jgi:hypothetical protein
MASKRAPKPDKPHPPLREFVHTILLKPNAKIASWKSVQV